jgi:hypothetical protein
MRLSFARPARSARSVFLAAALWAGLAGAAPAGDLADFNAAVEAVSSHNRVAIGYLRTGNTDLASLEIDRLRDAWHKLTARFAGHPPDAFAGNPLYPKLFTAVDARLVGADMMLNSGRAPAARQSLEGIRADLHKLRQQSSIVVLADCIGDASDAAAALLVYNKRDLDWSKPETRYAIAGKAAIYGHELARCDAMASDTIRKDPEFRRLIDGAQASLARIPEAIATRDAGLLHRVIIELRAIDNLLSFRYG